MGGLFCTESYFEQPGADERKLSGLAACGYGGATLTMSDLTALTVAVVVRATLAQTPVGILIIHSVS